VESNVLEAAEYGEVLTDANVVQFLAANNWTRHSSRGYDEVWIEPGSEGQRVAAVLVPREKRLADYSRRLREALADIARVYDWGLGQLAEQVAAIHADLFFVRVDQYSQDGTIPFRQAAALLEGIDDLIRASALTAWNPLGSGKGRTPGIVQDFLEQDLRMGHTKKGSFIITVAARLDEPAPSVANIGSDEPVPSFSRQVMTTLARSLDVTRRHLVQGDDFIDLEGAAKEGLRLPLVDALQRMGDGKALSSLDLSFEWAQSEPQREVAPARVVLERDVLAELPNLRARLKRKQPVEQVTVIGPVTELKRGDEPVQDAEDAGEIVVRGEVNQRTRRVTVPLSGVDYDWAIRAHRERLPFTVAGKLVVKGGNQYRLEEPIEVDRSFLEFRLGRAGYHGNPLASSVRDTDDEPT
jgi:hypothetical protein